MRLIFQRDVDGASGDVYFMRLAGLSTETKPTENVATGSIFIEVDTDKKYRYDEDSTSWTEEPAAIDPEAISEAVEDWLDDHPEATTVVVDGAITYAKLDSSLKGSVDDVSDLKNEIDDKQDAPATAGTAGQVLGLDSNLDPVWVNQQGGGGGAVDDVQINGVSIVSQGVANVPLANTSTPGAVVVGGGLRINLLNALAIDSAGETTIKTGTNFNNPVCPNYQHNAVFYGLAKAAGDSTQSSSSNTVGIYTESAKSAISQMLDAPETVSGTTPSITAKPGVRYICGECTTLDIAVPSSGCIDVTFESGSTPTVLTITPPTGMTMKWANGFDPTSLDANTTYEINILDGCYGVVGSWT